MNFIKKNTVPLGPKLFQHPLQPHFFDTPYKQLDLHKSSCPTHVFLMKFIVWFFPHFPGESKIYSSAPDPFPTPKKGDRVSNGRLTL